MTGIFIFFAHHNQDLPPKESFNSGLVDFTTFTKTGTNKHIDDS